ncbi:MAG TPA: SGNH/GDSL hydrolase family protein [Gemmatimonadales bacterium]|nr:SGNH/GDSL hydrolase family protein [Gemmatimonadales bacterium]
MQLRTLAAVALAALPLLAGCRTDDALGGPDLSATHGLFQRYVAMGNSITAGFQSGGINDSTQAQSYAVLVAQQAGVSQSFFVPYLNRPGCPAPIQVNSVNPPVLVGGSTTPGCALRRPIGSMPFVSNVAVPNATSFSPLSNTDPASNTNILTQMILGGRTQVQAMQAAKPTFVSAWIGNNDVLGALTSRTNPGNPALVTPLPVFQANYKALVDSIAATGAKAILIGVADVASIPYATPGAVYWCLKTGLCPGVPAGGFPPTLTVANNCSPASTPFAGQGEATLIPWVIALPKFAAAAQGVPQTIDCAVDEEVVLPAETQNLQAAVTGYNAFIKAQAAEHDWAYLDVNPVLVAAKAEIPAAGQQPKVATFPCLPGLTPAQVAAGTPCGPSGGLNKTPNVLFGTYFSLDGAHPSALAHRVIADSVIATINAKYATTIPLAGL